MKVNQLKYFFYHFGQVILYYQQGKINKQSNIDLFIQRQRLYHQKYRWFGVLIFLMKIKNS